MKVEFRLKQLLIQTGQDHHGIIQQISDEAHVHRHTVKRLYRNQLSRPSLEVVGKVAAWLEEHGVPARDLPQLLLGRSPADLWRAVVAPGHVGIYLGEYEQVDLPVGPGRWISLHDAEVAADLVKELTTSGRIVGDRPEVRLIYVPFRFSATAKELLQKPCPDDITRARELYDRMMSRGTHETAILVGSMRVNYMVEFLVSELFGCKPFETPKTPKVPFWLTYKPGARGIPSCFGSPKNPQALGPVATPGIYYLEDEDTGRWAFCEWRQKQIDAGIVLTVRDAGTNSLVVAAFGFSGYGTEAISKELIERGSEYWGHEVVVDGRGVGVYICRCRLRISEHSSERSHRSVEVEHADVVPLSEKVLKKRLRARS